MLKPLFYKSTLRLDQALSHLPSVGKFRPLKGTFSAVDRLRSGDLSGEILMDSQSTGSCPTGSITDLAGMCQHSHQPWPVFWAKSEDARLIGSMLHWRDSHDLLCLEGVFNCPQRIKVGNDRYFSQIFVSNSVVLPGAWTSIASNWGDGRNYFHWICDCLTRLYVRDHLPEESRILIPSNLSSFAMETLDLLGLTDQCLHAPSSCIQPERFYFCSPTAMTGVWNPIGWNWLRHNFARYQEPKMNGKPVFFTRRGIKRVPSNISEIEMIFANRGFQIIDCGNITVKEQIRLASAAPMIAGLHGAAMTNLLWAKSKTPVLEIFSSDYLNSCYEQIAFQGDLQYSAIVMNEKLPSTSAIKAWLHSSIS